MDTIVTDPKNISTLTGLMFAITGLVSAFSSINIGKLNEKLSSKFLLTVCLLGTGCFFLLQAFVTNVTQLTLLRFGLGFFYGGIIPTANIIISLSTPSQDRGKIFGIANSITFSGNIFGPIAGGFIITTFSLTAIFVFTGSLLLLAGLTLPAIVKKSEKTKTYNRTSKETTLNI